MLDVNTVEQVASELQVTIRVVRRLLHDKKLAGFKVGGVYRIPRSAVEAYMAGEVVASGESVVVDKTQTEEEGLKEQLRVANLKTEIAEQDIKLKEVTGLRDRPEQLDAREAEIDTRESALDTKEAAMDELAMTREADYNALLIRVAEGVDESINAGMAEERAVAVVVVQEAMLMYEMGARWCIALTFACGVQGGYSDRGEEAQLDIAKRGKTMMEAVGFKSRLSELFDFNPPMGDVEERAMNKRHNKGGQ